jgi:hypothetical protein
LCPGSFQHGIGKDEASVCQSGVLKHGVLQREICLLLWTPQERPRGTPHK